MCGRFVDIEGSRRKRAPRTPCEEIVVSWKMEVGVQVEGRGRCREEETKPRKVRKGRWRSIFRIS